MNLSSVSAASIVGKVLRLPLRAIPASTVLPVLQGPLRGKKWIVGSGNHGCWLGSYEHELQRIFDGLVKRDSVVWDVGANVGFYSLIASRKAKRVVAFEPLPQNTEYLRRHIQLNRITNIDIDQSALSDREGTARFDVSHNRSVGHLSERGISVSTKTIDSCEWPTPALIKIDAEGAELSILQGGAECLATRKPVLFLATHSEVLKESCAHFLREVGYRVSLVADDQLLAES